MRAAKITLLLSAAILALAGAAYLVSGIIAY